MDDSKPLDEKELLRAQIKAYEFYAHLIERAVGGGAQAKLPRWDEQRATEYYELAEQLRRRLAELEAQEQTAGEGETSHDTPSPEARAPAAGPSDAREADSTREASETGQTGTETGIMVPSSDVEPVAHD